MIKNKLFNIASVTENLFDSEVVSLSQELDKLICQYYLMSDSY